MIVLLRFTGFLVFPVGTWENWDAHNHFCHSHWPQASHLTLLPTCGLSVSCLMVPSVVLVRIASSLFVSLAISRIRDKNEDSCFFLILLLDPLMP
jgi:hypothetical protein